MHNFTEIHCEGEAVHSFCDGAGLAGNENMQFRCIMANIKGTVEDMRQSYDGKEREVSH